MLPLLYWYVMAMVILMVGGSPAITSVLPQNTPSTGGSSVTLYGSSLAWSPTGVIGITSCVATVWVSVASLVCKAPGSGNSATMAIGAKFATISGGVVTGSGTLAADEGALTDFHPANGPTGSIATVVVLGSNFGSSDPTEQIAVRGTECSASNWVSQTALVCLIGANTASALLTAGSTGGTVHVVPVIGPGVRGDLTQAFSFNRIAPTRVNLPASGGIYVSIVGTGFGTANVTVKARISSTATQGAVWTSDSCVVIKSQALPSGLNNLTVVVTVAGPTGVVKGAIASPPVVVDAGIGISAVPNAVLPPATGSVSLTLFGAACGVNPTTTKVRVGSTACTATRWASFSTIVSKAPNSLLHQANEIFTVGLSKSTSSYGISFAVPATNAISVTNTGPGGENMLTLVGSGFGSADYTVRVRVGNTASEVATWIADSSAVVKLPSSSWLQVANASITLTVGRNGSPLTFRFSYNTMTVSFTNLPATGARILNLVGYGFINTTPTITIGTVPCEAAFWVSTSIVSCKVPASTSGAYSATLQLQPGTSLSTPTQVSIDAFVITTVSPNNIPSTGAFSISFQGSNFNTHTPSPTTRVGGSGSEACVWTSDSSVATKTPQASPNPAVVVATAVHAVGSVIALPLISNTPPMIMLFVAGTVQLFDVDTFISVLASILGINVPDVQVLAVAAASVRITMRINREDWQLQYQAMKDDLASADSQLRVQLHVSSIQDYLTGVVTAPGATGPSPSDIKYNARLALSVVAASVGTAFVMLTGYSVYVIMRAVNSRNAKRDRERDEAKRVERRITG